MTRISLVEAYDDKDVITQIAKIKDKLDSIPDDADLSNCVLKVNNQIIDGRKTFNDVIIANDGIAVTGDLNVDGNIVQSGVAVEVHVEEVFTKNDYITMREDAATAIPPGQFSGLQIEKYDGVNDCRLVVDDQGVARVGDVSDEQPLATRDESADMFSGALVTWDGVNNKLIAPDSDVGDDTHPVKIVDGVPSAVTDALQKELQNERQKVWTTRDRQLRRIHIRRYRRNRHRLPDRSSDGCRTVVRSHSGRYFRFIHRIRHYVRNNTWLRHKSGSVKLRSRSDHLHHDRSLKR